VLSAVAASVGKFRAAYRLHEHPKVRLDIADFDPCCFSPPKGVRPRFGPIVAGAPAETTYVHPMAISKTDLSLLLGLLSLLATLGLSPVLLLAALVAFLVGRATG
jgi:hypothetical protein